MPSELLETLGAWWRAHRPLAYSEEKHLDNPTVNMLSAEEDLLALAYVAHLKATHEAHAK